jgi:hypothetical protein
LFGGDDKEDDGWLSVPVPGLDELLVMCNLCARTRARRKNSFFELNLPPWLFYKQKENKNFGGFRETKR